MADHLSEEEQIEALKRWWNENWVSIVLPIILVLVGYFGWNFWNNQQLAEAQSASDQFQALTEQAEVAPGMDMSAEQKVGISQSAEALVAEHEGTLYADMASLMLARLHVEDNQLEAAAARLQSVVDGGSNESISLLATARLARVLAAKGEPEQALQFVAQTSSEAYTALFAEIRGDIYQSQGKYQEAHTAYGVALETLPPTEYNRSSLIQLKRDAAALPESEPEVVDAEGDA
ncbi:YfgM family protein [Teredinibacter purpureus]|uniref:YfgM family protein n=1 Tax=Teredinibacter purpureus TaxID=2731756 RepID=UPI0005F83A69|nr:tetratricopeptide repeat protein [Teredinibacter purpureus]